MWFSSAHWKTGDYTPAAVNQTQATSTVCLDALQPVVEIESTPVDTALASQVVGRSPTGPQKPHIAARKNRRATLGTTLATSSLPARRQSPPQVLFLAVKDMAQQIIHKHAHTRPQLCFALALQRFFGTQQLLAARPGPFEEEDESASFHVVIITFLP